MSSRPQENEAVPAAKKRCRPGRKKTKRPGRKKTKPKRPGRGRRQRSDAEAVFVSEYSSRVCERLGRCPQVRRRAASGTRPDARSAPRRARARGVEARGPSAAQASNCLRTAATCSRPTGRSAGATSGATVRPRGAARASNPTAAAATRFARPSQRRNTYCGANYPASTGRENTTLQRKQRDGRTTPRAGSLARGGSRPSGWRPSD